MAELRWADLALDDIDQICEFIAEDNPVQAAKLAARFDEMADQVLALPKMGRIVPEYQRPELRERIHGRYRMLYRLNPDYIEIVRIFHSARQLPSDL